MPQKYKRRQKRRKAPLYKEVTVGMPAKKLVKLRYVDHVSLAGPSSNIAVHYYSANGMYDPNNTGTGHQPSNFDFWTGAYDNFTVLGSKCQVYPVHTTTSNVTPGVLIATLSQDGSAISTAHASGGIDNILEQPRLRKSMRNIGMANITPMKPLVLKFSAKKFFGTNKLVGVGKYTGKMGSADPSEEAFFEIAIVSPDDANNPGSFKVRVVIDYIAMLTEPKITDSS